MKRISFIAIGILLCSGAFAQERGADNNDDKSMHLNGIYVGKRGEGVEYIVKPTVGFSFSGKSKDVNTMTIPSMSINGDVKTIVILENGLTFGAKGGGYFAFSDRYFSLGPSFALGTRSDFTIGYTFSFGQNSLLQKLTIGTGIGSDGGIYMLNSTEEPTLGARPASYSIFQWAGYVPVRLGVYFKHFSLFLTYRYDLGGLNHSIYGKEILTLPFEISIGL